MAASLGGIVAITPASAQEAATAAADESQIQDIVVTAQKRSENLQKVPIAVAVATASELQASGVSQIQALKIIAPGMEVKNLNAYALPVLRGVGSKLGLPGVESPIAIYVDGVYYASTTSTMLSFNNIAQVEVLKGPQGTLFGRNATGGLIQVTTRDPKQEFQGEINLGYGNYDTKKGDIYVTGGLANGLSADLAVMSTFQGDGYGTNAFNGQDVYRTFHDVAARSKWKWEGERTTARLIFDYQNLKTSQQTQRIPLGYSSPAILQESAGSNPWDVAVDVQPLLKLKTGGVSLRVDQELGFANFVSISAYRRTNFNVLFDADYSTTRRRSVNINEDARQFSQEIQLNSKSHGPVTWMVGAYYFNAGGKYNPISLFNGQDGLGTLTPLAVIATRSNHTTDSISGFGQATIKLLDNLNLTGGLRYTSEKRALKDASQVRQNADGTVTNLTPPPLNPITFNKLTYRVALDYNITSNILGYLSLNRGYKSGGFNPGALALPSFKPETLDAYEVGLKTTLFDRRVRLNGAGFYYDYSDVQVQRLAPNGLATGIYNAPKAEIYGFDADLEARVTPQFDLRLGYQYLHGRYTDFPGAVASTVNPAGGYFVGIGNVTGNRTVLSPKHTFSATGGYTVPISNGEVKFTASYYYNSGSYEDPDNLVKSPGYSLVNASVRWRSANDKFTVALWGNNLTNKAVTSFLGIVNLGYGFAGMPGIQAGVTRASYEPPRTYGVTVGAKF